MSILATISSSGDKYAPGAPTIGTATNNGTGRTFVSGGRADVTFTAPTDTGRSTITSYTVTSNTGGFTGTGASSPISVTGLTPGNSYTFTVTATNAAGFTSAASSASNSITATTIPAVPTIGTASVVSATSVSVAFTAGGTGGLSVTYNATGSPAGSGSNSASPISVTGLTTGTAYTFTVTATNSNGTSSASGASNSVTPNYTGISAWTVTTVYPSIDMYPPVGQSGTTNNAWVGTGSNNGNTSSDNTGYYWTTGSGWTSNFNSYNTYQPGNGRISSTENLLVGGYNFTGAYLANVNRRSGNSWVNGTAFPRTTLTPFVGKVSDGILVGMGTDGGNTNLVYKNTAYNGTWTASTNYPISDANAYIAVDNGTMSFITVFVQSNTGLPYRTSAVSSTWTLQSNPPVLDSFQPASINSAASAINLMIFRNSGNAYIYNNTTYTATTQGPLSYNGTYNTPVLSALSTNTRVEWVDGQRQTSGTRAHYFATLV
jgi:hypothetical protein